MGFVAGVAKVFALVIAVVAAVAAALIVIPALGMKMALAAIVASELSALIAAGAIVALPLAFFGFTRGRRAPSTIAVVLVVGSIGACILPIAQARSLAKARGVQLDFRRYLQARIDSQGPGRPDQTVTYATVNGTPLGLDVYLPHARPAKPGRPIVVIHGGFWSAGQKGEATLASRHLADLGFTVFDIQYRITPQPNWKTATGDVKCAIGWVKRHAETPDWNVDPTKLALLGRSAGGHLALLAAMSPGDPNIMPSCSAGDTSVAAVAALYPATDLTRAYEHPGNLWVYDLPQKVRDFLGGRPDTVPAAYREASPVSRVGGGAQPAPPRVLLAHGARDQFIPAEQTTLLGARMREAGLAPDVLVVPYGQHAFDFVSGGLSGQILERALLQLFSGVR